MSSANMLGTPRAAPARRGLLGLWLILVIAALLSIAAIWLVTNSPLATVAYGGGLVMMGAMGWLFLRERAPSDIDSFATPDWSVTVSAIDQSERAVAITDRANRLVCANALYVDWFGAGEAPPHLTLDRESSERLARAARTAWREGSAECEALKASHERRGAGAEAENGLNSPAKRPTSWDCEVVSAGRGEDYLVWRFSAQIAANATKALGSLLTANLGNMLSQAGIEAAIVGKDGALRAVSRGFAQRGAGDADATLVGQDFVSLLRSDEKERIYFAREGREGAPQTLIHVPLSDPPEDGSTPPGPDEVPSLMLLVDARLGLGGEADHVSKAQAEDLSALLGVLPLGLAMTDRDGRFLFGNDAFLRAVGREGQGLPAFPSDLVVKEDKSPLADAVRRFGRGAASNGNMAVRLRDAPEDPVSLGLSGVRGLGVASVLLSLTDSTEEARLKRQVAQATKMQAVGQLAGGVAHDFNNVLTAIIGYCDLMLLRHTPGDSDYDDIQQIHANSNRAASLTRQLLAFSRQQTLRPEVLQLPDVVSEVSQLLRRLIGEKITLKVRHDRDLGPVRADPQQLEQVIVNLAVNARDAIQSNGDGSGTLSMTTRRVLARDVRQMGSDIIPIADYTVLVVQDTGGGIPPAVLGKIFEPFFTTKDQGKGTGLGLSTVYGIVKQSGGFIFADNVMGHDRQPVGARFTVYLPAHYDASPSSVRGEEEEPEASDWSGGGKVLLVEDEDMVRAVAERALSRSGYSVTCCSDGEEGLAAVANGGEFDIVVTDVVMPGMDGPAMARAIRQVKPQLPFLFMSGYAEEQLRADIDIEAMYFLPKPFSVQQISEKVGEVLGAFKGRQ